ncbi:MAG TPA: hypothetical protein VGM23_09100 [Armatimonadota bacterium]|jgi:hypothetical protein
MTKSVWSLFILWAMIALSLPAFCAQGGMVDLLLEARCDKSAGAINDALVKGDAIQAIVATGEYERMLSSQFPPASYAQGTFRSQAFHLSLHLTASAWTQVDAQRAQIPEELLKVGIECPLLLENHRTGDAFAVILLENGWAAAKGESLDEIDEQEILANARLIGKIGMIKSHSLKTVGNQRVLAVAYYTEEHVPGIMYYLQRGGHIYIFALFTPGKSYQQCEQILASIVQGANFQYQPANTRIIGEIQQQLTDPASIPQLLTCTKELALAGEINAAKDCLVRMRGVLGDLIPKPLVENTIASYAAFGMKLYNPNPARWALSAVTAKHPYSILLADRTDEGRSGIAVVAINVVQYGGAKAAQQLSLDMNGMVQRTLFSSASRGYVRGSGYTLESEGVRTFKGVNAYESIAVKNSTTRMKCIIFTHATNLIFVDIFAPQAYFNTRVAEYEALLEKHLVFATN